MPIILFAETYTKWKVSPSAWLLESRSSVEYGRTRHRCLW